MDIYIMSTSWMPLGNPKKEFFTLETDKISDVQPLTITYPVGAWAKVKGKQKEGDILAFRTIKIIKENSENGRHMVEIVAIGKIISYDFDEEMHLITIDLVKKELKLNLYPSETYKNVFIKEATPNIKDELMKLFDTK